MTNHPDWWERQGWTPADLEANRAGQLAPTQLATMRDRMRSSAPTMAMPCSWAHARGNINADDIREWIGSTHRTRAHSRRLPQLQRTPSGRSSSTTPAACSAARIASEVLKSFSRRAAARPMIAAVIASGSSAAISRAPLPEASAAQVTMPETADGEDDRYCNVAE